LYNVLDFRIYVSKITHQESWFCPGSGIEVFGRGLGEEDAE